MGHCGGRAYGAYIKTDTRTKTLRVRRDKSNIRARRETVGIEEEMTQPWIEGGERAGQADEGMEIVETVTIDTPLNQVSPDDMEGLLNAEIKNKTVYVKWDLRDGEPNGYVKVWVGQQDLPEKYDKMKETQAKYLIHRKTERVWVIDQDNQDMGLIGKGLGAIINLENDKKQWNGKTKPERSRI